MLMGRCFFRTES